MAHTSVATELRAAVAGLADEISARAAETERDRAVPDDLMARIKAAGLCRLGMAAGLGGLELDPVTVVELVESICHADGSTGWSTLIGNSTAFFAWLEPETAKALLAGNVDTSSTSMFGPLGTARVDGDELIVRGRWPFNSGASHAEVFQVGVFVTEGGPPLMRADGRPDWRFAYLRRDEVVIDDDTWRAAGLRGTASHDVVVEDVRIPADRTAMPMFDDPRHEGPLWRLPFFVLARTMMVGFPLGVARRALDELAALAPTKRRAMSELTIAQDRAAQVQVAQAEAGLRAARAFVVAVLDDALRTVSAGERLSVAQDRCITLAVQQAMRAGVEAVDTAFHLAGAGAVYDTHPLQRCFRDIRTGNQHIIFSDEMWAEYGRFALGADEVAG